MKQRKNKSMLMTVVLTLALVFTMMPAMAWADETTAPAQDTNEYYQLAAELTDGSYLITVYDNDDIYGLKGPSVNTDQTPVTESQVLTTDGTIVINPDPLCVWNYTSNNKMFRNKQSGGSLYFSSQGMKYQEQGYRGLQYDEGYLRLYAHSTDGTTSGSDIYATFADGSFGTVVDKESEAATIFLLKRTYHVQYDLNGGSGPAAPAFSDENDQVALPRAPEPESYLLLFDGWTDGKETYDAGEVVTVSENTIFTAKYKEDPDPESTLNKAKEKAAAEVGKYTTDEELNNYNEIQRTIVKTLAEDCLSEIQKATSIPQVNNLVSAFEDNKDNVPTKRFQENVTDLIKSGIEGMLADYKPEQQKELLAKLDQYIASVMAAKTKTEVEEVSENFLSAVKEIPTAAAIDEQIKKVQATAVIIKKAKAQKKKKVTVTWAANAAAFDGYQIQYKIKGKKYKKWKKVSVASPTAAKKVVKKLKKGKKYQFKVRGYKTINGTKVWGKFSKTKTTKKIKK